MITTLVRRFGGNKVISETFILWKVLEELGITPSRLILSRSISRKDFTK